MGKISPILKWAGGKRQLLHKLLPLIPNDFNRYYEPFVGAGAILFGLQPRHALINDINEELMNTYEVIKASPDKLISYLYVHERHHCKEYYYEVRARDRNPYYFERMNPIAKAARTIYLNKTCFNGLYRVNKRGHFNTPIGRSDKKNIRIANESVIMAISEYLNNADIQMTHEAYHKILSNTEAGDFVFLDPPYYPTTKDYFIQYDSSYFGVEQQTELKNVCDLLNERGTRFIQTNSHCQEIFDLYSAYSIDVIEVRRNINSRADGRRGTEVIIRNY